MNVHAVDDVAEDEGNNAGHEETEIVVGLEHLLDQRSNKGEVSIPVHCDELRGNRKEKNDGGREGNYKHLEGRRYGHALWRRDA